MQGTILALDEKTQKVLVARYWWPVERNREAKLEPEPIQMSMTRHVLLICRGQCMDKRFVDIPHLEVAWRLKSFVEGKEARVHRDFVCHELQRFIDGKVHTTRRLQDDIGNLLADEGEEGITLDGKQFLMRHEKRRRHRKCRTGLQDIASCVDGIWILIILILGWYDKREAKTRLPVLVIQFAHDTGKIANRRKANHLIIFERLWSLAKRLKRPVI